MIQRTSTRSSRRAALINGRMSEAARLHGRAVANMVSSLRSILDLGLADYLVSEVPAQVIGGSEIDLASHQR